MLRRIAEKELATVRAALLEKQNGKCPLCKEPFAEPKDICVDHDHKTGFIRALLCRNCNSMEGKLFNCARRAKRNLDPIEWLKNVLEYIILHQTCQTGLIHHTHRTADEKRLRQNKRERLKRKRAKKLLKKAP